jgi:streptogramin lyase
VYRLVRDEWQRIRIDEQRIAKGHGAAAVGPDGALWLGMEDGKLMRVSAKDEVDTFDLPTADAKLTRAHYETHGTFAVQGTAKGNLAVDADAARHFELVSVYPAAEPKPIGYISAILPRADGEAWVVARDSSQATVIIHMSRPAIAPLPEALFVGSEADQRNEVRNARPPITWVGHCAQLFVTLAKQRVDGSLPSEAKVWSREAVISDAVKKASGKVTTTAPAAAIVEGRLGGRRVAGVLLWRPLPESSEELLEKTASAIAAELSDGMMPEITCTAPVLERASGLSSKL